MTEAERIILRKVALDLEQAASDADRALDTDSPRNALGALADSLPASARELRDMLG